MGVFLPLLLYGVIGGGALFLAFLVYARAVASRRVRECRHCGEIIRTELMEARYCNVCGTPLEKEEFD